ncbi:SHOCT domain-containing protein [Microbacterium deminutum]|uniref:SHOCT domain-containing protein n=1 Tax=Microbacterium deminutum TaxID=344164 RepID=A0ABN2QE43_9MICO
MFFWWLLWFFYVAAYIYVVILIISDLFRDEKLSGWLKAVWIIFLVFVPFLTALVYVIARGSGMAERAAAARGYTMPESDDYHPSASANPADDIAKAKELLDAGVISQGEFDALKSKALGNQYFGA